MFQGRPMWMSSKLKSLEKKWEYALSSLGDDDDCSFSPEEVVKESSDSFLALPLIEEHSRNLVDIEFCGVKKTVPFRNGAIGVCYISWLLFLGSVGEPHSHSFPQSSFLRI